MDSYRAYSKPHTPATSAGHDPSHRLRLRGGLARAVGIINAAVLPELGNEEMKRASG
jgi:hypothetical protein